MSAALEESRATEPDAARADAGPDVAVSLTRVLTVFGA
jgi:hypothetical protein